MIVLRKDFYQNVLSTFLSHLVSNLISLFPLAPSVSIKIDDSGDGINCSTRSCNISQKSNVKATCFVHYDQVILEESTSANFNWILQNQDTYFLGCNSTCQNCNCSISKDNNQVEFNIYSINVNQNGMLRCQVNFTAPYLPSSFDSGIELKVTPVIIPSLQVLPINIQRGQLSVTMTCKSLYTMDVYAFDSVMPLPIAIVWIIDDSLQLTNSK